MSSILSYISIPVLLLSLSLLGCDDPESADDAGRADAAGSMDSGRSQDAGRRDGGRVDGASGDDASAVDGGGSADGGRRICGAGRPTLTGITDTEGLIVARDGTIYYSQSDTVGRLPVGGSPENDFVEIPSSPSTVWGLALSPDNETLYVGAPSAGVFSIDLRAAEPSAAPIDAGGAPNGLTVRADGTLFFSDFGADRVYRIEPGSTAEEVTSSTIDGANGLAFLPDGRLLVASYFTDTVFVLTLDDDDDESARETFASSINRPDGIALDADGNVYVSSNVSGDVHRMNPDGSDRTAILESLNAPASLDFGSGALNCQDLYVATRGAVARYNGSVDGYPVPWH